MRQKSSKTANHFIVNIHTALKEHLMKDFSASLASRIVEHNVRKHRADIIKSGEYTKLINAIVSDYQAIRPLGHSTIADLKRELHDAVRQISI